LPIEITKENLEDPFKGKPISGLFDLMISGNAHVNVHTFPYTYGERRGQINLILFTLPYERLNLTNTRK
jgi:hypothetical protein